MQEHQVRTLNAMVAAETRRCRLAARTKDTVRRQVLQQEDALRSKAQEVATMRTALRALERARQRSELGEEEEEGNEEEVEQGSSSRGWKEARSVPVRLNFAAQLEAADSDAKYLAVLQEATRARKRFELQIAAEARAARTEVRSSDSRRVSACFLPALVLTHDPL